MTTLLSVRLYLTGCAKVLIRCKEKRNNYNSFKKKLYLCVGYVIY